MGTHRTLVAAVGALAAIVMFPHAVFGESGQVYVADEATAVVWSFVDTVAVPLNEEHPIPEVVGLALRADGQILVAGAAEILLLDPDTGLSAVVDTTAYGVVDVYPDCASDDVYYVISLWEQVFSLRVLLGGTAPPYDCVSFSGPPLDLQVYPSGERAGHVIVLVDGGGDFAPYLAEFQRTDATTFEELPPILEAIPGDPVNFAIRPDGRVVLLDRSSGMYDVGMQGDLTHFGPSEVGSWEKMDIGANGTIYVTDTELNLTHRFDPDGNWILPSLEGGVQMPAALAAVGFTPTPPGEGVPVTPVAGVDLLFEEITNGGYTSATTTETMDRVSPGGNALPEYVAAPGGREGFTYVSLATTAVFENLIQVDVLLPGSRLFFAHGTGGTFRDVTVEGTLEDARGVISRFSEVVVVDDTRPLAAVIDDKFARLFEILSPNVAARRGSVEWAKRSLRARAQLADRLYRSGHADAAIEELSDLNAQARVFAGTAIPNSSASPGGNLAGEILSRSKTLMFSLSLLAGRQDDALARSAGNGLSLACASPARGECRMEIAGPVGAWVTADLYTIGGRLVKTLFDGVLSSRRETLVWDGTDSIGRPVSSGVYLARVESGNALATGKVVFIR